MEEKVTCTRCDREFLASEATPVNGNIYCPNCMSMYHECECCGDSSFDCEAIGDYWYCEHCADNFGECSVCGCSIHYEDTYRFHEDDESYCESCYNERFRYCEECDQDWDTREHTNCPICNEYKTSKLFNYSYKPNPIFYGEGDIFYGFEIECDTCSSDRLISIQDIYTKINKEEDLIYIKKDGSLGACGIEIVSHPLDYKYSIDLLSKISLLQNLCIKNGTNGYGVHIHVTKKAIKDKIHLSKLLYFFAKNNKFIEFIAEREATRYCLTEKNSNIIQKVEHQNLKRYDAVNIVNKNTIEFRMFKTNLDKLNLIKNIQFIISIIEYTDKVSLLGLNKNGFTKYVNESTEFKELQKFLKTT